VSFEFIELLIQISAIAFFAWLYFALSKFDKQLKDQDSDCYKNFIEQSPRAFRVVKKLMPKSASFDSFEVFRGALDIPEIFSTTLEEIT